MYLLTQILYTFVGKKFAVFEIFLVASGFVLRTVSGGFAVSVPVSDWLLIVVASTSLFVVSGKRFGEFMNQGTSSPTRESLQLYSSRYLQVFWTVSLALSLVFYALWAVELDRAGNSNFALISLTPFAIAMFTYALHIDRGEAETPEDLFLGSPIILCMVGIWAALFSLELMV